MVRSVHSAQSHADPKSVASSDGSEEENKENKSGGDEDEQWLEIGATLSVSFFASN